VTAITRQRCMRMIAFPWLFPGVFKGVAFPGVVRDTASNLSLGGHVTVTGLGVLFSGRERFSLFVAFLFARQVIGSDTGTPECKRSPEPSRKAPEAFLKRQYKTVAALLGLLLPTFASAQEHAGGGEANLTLPDLSSVNFSA
jgi:hypothetical protein